MKKIIKNKELVFIVSVFILLLLPLLIISRYNHPSADDYNYSIKTFQAWSSDHSLISLIKASGQTVLGMRNHWHGAYAAVFIMSFQPAIFGIGMYFFSFVFLASVFIFANYYLLKTIINQYIKSDRKNMIVLCLSIIMVSMQFLPSVVQGFFWWNGAINYTFFYSLSLILFLVILNYLKSDNKKHNLIYIILMFVLSILIGGGNYSTPVPTLIILFLFMSYNIFKKNKKAIPIIISFLLLIIGLIISIKCPGTLIRQRQENLIGLDPINAILQSLKTAIGYFRAWSKLYMVIIFLYIGTVIYRMVDKSQLKISFRYPIIFTILTFGIVASHFTAPLYSLGYPGDGRLHNLVFFYYVWFITINIFYYLGWLKQKLSNQFSVISNAFINLFKENRIYIVLVLAITAFYSLHLSDYNKISSLSATKSLINGEAQTYDSEMNQRIESYKNDNLKIVEVKDLSVRPYTLFFSDISEDDDYWANNSLEQYYNKTSVYIKKDDVIENE